MSNNIEHRACFDLPAGQDLTKHIMFIVTTPRGFGVDFLKRFENRESEESFLKRVAKTIEITKGQEQYLLYSGRGAGKTFLRDNLKAQAAQNTMPCPHCAMKCEKVRDGYFQRVKYEYFHCTNCKKNFKITLSK